MGRLIRIGLGAALAAAIVAVWPKFASRGQARWFLPGAMGYEPGSSPPATEAGFRTRAFTGLNSPGARQWGQRNGLTESLAFSHNLNRVFPPELYGAKPEFFPLVAGKRIEPPKDSYFWNPDIAREDAARHAARSAKEFFDARPEAVSFALGVNDALLWGESDELRALATPVRWFRERPDYSDVVFGFMNRSAEALAHSHPDKYLGALAYYWCENTPSFALHPRVIPFLTADRAQGYDAEFWREEMELQAKWGQLAGARGEHRRESAAFNFQPSTFNSAPANSRRLGLYDYLYGAGFLIPRIHTRLIAEHLKHAAQAGFTDYYAEVNPNWGLDGPMPWLVAQLVQDPRQDVGRLLDEYYTRYFGAAAGPMRRFFERCEELWMAQPGPAYWLKHYRNESQAGVFPSAACRELRAWLTEAESRAHSARVRARVRLTSEAFGVTERFVRMKEQRDELLRACLSPQPERLRIPELVRDYRASRGEFVRYTYALRRRVPLAVHAFGWDDYLKNDPSPLAAAVVGEFQATQQPGRELLGNAALTGEPVSARRIAELTYSVALPAPWQSKVEPAEHHRASLRDTGDGRVLRIEGTRDTMMSQWVPVGEAGLAGLHTALVGVRGRVSPSNAVWLILAFLDAQHRHVGFRTVRLPDGEWPAWVTLRQAADAPANAAWVGIGLRIQNQLAGDWIEARQFSLRY